MRVGSGAGGTQVREPYDPPGCLLRTSLQKPFCSCTLSHSPHQSPLHCLKHSCVPVQSPQPSVGPVRLWKSALTTVLPGRVSPARHCSQCFANGSSLKSCNDPGTHRWELYKQGTEVQRAREATCSRTHPAGQRQSVNVNQARPQPRQPPLQVEAGAQQPAPKASVPGPVGSQPSKSTHWLCGWRPSPGGPEGPSPLLPSWCPAQAPNSEEPRFPIRKMGLHLPPRVVAETWVTV